MKGKREGITCLRPRAGRCRRGHATRQGRQGNADSANSRRRPHRTGASQCVELAGAHRGHLLPDGGALLGRAGLRPDALVDRLGFGDRDIGRLRAGDLLRRRAPVLFRLQEQRQRIALGCPGLAGDGARC